MVLFEILPISPLLPSHLYLQQDYSKRLEDHYFSTKPLKADVYKNS